MNFKIYIYLYLHVYKATSMFISIYLYKKYPEAILMYTHKYIPNHSIRVYTCMCVHMYVFIKVIKFF